jgi:glycosyltransferase involved in cell wall biosynthesis
MARRPELRFVSTGGAVPDHESETHRLFWSRARSSRFASRFEERGRLARTEALEVLAGGHVVVCVSRRCLEAELGSRQRVVEALAQGRGAVVSDLGDLAGEIQRHRAGLVVPPEDAAALAEALVRLASERELLESCAGNGRRLWERLWTYEATTVPLQRFVGEPKRWPPGGGSGAPSAEPSWLRLQAELDAIRGSHTFRALRLIDRLLGRGPARQRD